MLRSSVAALQSLWAFTAGSQTHSHPGVPIAVAWEHDPVRTGKHVRFSYSSTRGERIRHAQARSMLTCTTENIGL